MRRFDKSIYGNFINRTVISHSILIKYLESYMDLIQFLTAINGFHTVLLSAVNYQSELCSLDNYIFSLPFNSESEYSLPFNSEDEYSIKSIVFIQSSIPYSSQVTQTLHHQILVRIFSNLKLYYLHL